MSTIQNPRQVARPPRRRVVLARLEAAFDSLDRHLVAFALTVGTLASVALALFIAFEDDRATTAVLSVAVCAFIALMAFAATDDAVTTACRKAHRAAVASIVAKHDAARDEWNRYCDQVAERNEARHARVLGERNDALEALRKSSRDRDAEAIAAQHLEDYLRESLRQVTAERDALIVERDAVARLALRMSGIDLPRGVTIQQAALTAFYIARGYHESSDDMTERDYAAAQARLVSFALDGARLG